MKKLLILFTALIALVGCKKSDNEIFDAKPEERLAATLADAKAKLLSSPNGWVATLPTSAGGGFGFHITFDASENVKMYGDLNATASTTQGTSTYRLKTVLGTELIFDTFNYISMLVDPVPSVFGGAAGSGFKSDVEFLYTKSNGDTLFFTGKKYNQPLVMVKATQAQKNSYDAGGYKAAIDKFTAYFANTKNPYIEIVSGAATLKAGISVNSTSSLSIGKRVGFTGVLADGVSTASGTAKFAFKLDGADLLGPGLTYVGIKFVRFAWKDASTLALYDSTGKEYVIKTSPVPLTPLGLLFGFPTTFPYKKIAIPSTGLPTGVTSGFTAVYNQMLSLFTASGRTVTSTNFVLSSNSLFLVEVNYTSGTSAFVASATYNYTKTGDVITLDNNPVPNVNWPTRAVQIKPLADYMLTGPFKIDWVSSTNPANPLLGGLYRTGDLSSFIYGAL